MEDKAALILGGGGITGGVYELGVLSALDDFVVGGRRPTDFDIYVGISSGSLLAAFLANGISVKNMCRAVLGEEGHRLLLRREDIYEFRFSPLFRAAWKFVRSTGPVVRYLRRMGQPVTFLNAIALFQQFLPSGFFSNANLERYVARILSEEGRNNEFRKLSKKLYIAATEIDTGERWVFGPNEVTDVPISKAIQASSAIPVFFEPVRIRDRFFVDGVAERASHLDIPVSAGAGFILMINPTVPIYNDRTVVCIPTVLGHCSSITETGLAAIAEQTFRINSRVKLELGIEIFRQQHPGTELLLIEPAPMESTLFLYGSMNFTERVQVLNYGYNSAAFFFMENFAKLRDSFAKAKMEVSLERISTDRFLEFAARLKGRRRFQMKIHYR
ncbi:MAG: patatin-like phospholipase family protein [Deltaproteobacteria bacterium]|nr:patatin-like phospholipase family protein [Deltaproteobacteria bacterium]